MLGSDITFRFALAGALIDSIELIVQSFNHTTTGHLRLVLPREAIVETIGRSLTQVLEEIAPGHGALLLATYREFLHARPLNSRSAGGTLTGWLT